MQKEVVKIKKPKYEYVGKETITQIIGKTFPRQLIPTKRMGAIFGFIFLLVLLMAVFTFPFKSLISGNGEISIAIGYPFPFLNFGLTEEEGSPLRIGGFAIDLILYLIISYAIDVLITLILKNPFLGSKEEIGKYPIVFKDKKPKNISETVTKKIFQKESKGPPKKIKNKTTSPQENKQPRSQPNLSQQS